MSHTHYVIAAYSVTFIAMAWLIVSSWSAMRRSEALADDLRRDP